MPTVAIASEFLEAYAWIPCAQQKKVREFTEKFQANPKCRLSDRTRWSEQRTLSAAPFTSSLIDGWHQRPINDNGSAGKAGTVDPHDPQCQPRDIPADAAAHSERHAINRPRAVLSTSWA
jgi:hypothetical protein